MPIKGSPGWVDMNRYDQGGKSEFENEDEDDDENDDNDEDDE